MGLFTGKKGIIMGVANDHSIAWSIAKALHQEGAEIGFNHLPDKEGRNRMERRLKSLAEPIGSKLMEPCDVADDEQIKSFFGKVREIYGSIDFFVHSIAFAPLDDIRCATLDASREGFKIAMDISVYSFLATAKAAAELMPNGGSIVAMSYFGGEKVVGGYNMMGVCKAALDMSIRYAAFDLGPKNIRVNGISAGPMRTLAASAVGEFHEMMRLYEAVSPMGRNITSEEVGNTAAYLLSGMSTATTGDVLHVDCGYHVMGSPGHAIDRLGLEAPKA